MTRRAQRHGGRLGARLCAGLLVFALIVPAARAAGESRQSADANVFNSIAQWLDRSFDDFNHGVQDVFRQIGTRTRDDLKSASDQTADTLASITAIPNTRIITRRRRCARAANGAPDCHGAATAICRAGGFTSGNSLDVQAEEKCPAAVYLGRREARAGDCRTETYVVRSVCQ